MNVLNVIGQRELLLGGLVLTVLVLATVARYVRRVARSEKPDEPISNVSMLLGLGWSAEAMWVICRVTLQLPLGLTIALCTVFEVMLLVAMLRAKRHVREFGWPGRFGTTAWIIAGSMATVAAFASQSLAEAALRIAIPLLVTKQWWDGLVGGSARRPADASSWRWTPRRLLLALGAIEPGERDVETVHRERLTQRMTNLEHRRRHGWPRLAGRRAARLARLTLMADDDIIAEVRSRVDRTSWFEVKHPAIDATSVPAVVPAGRAASRKAARVLHGKRIRTVWVKHPVKVVVAAQESKPDPRSNQEIDDAIRFMKAGSPDLSQRRIAELLLTSDTKVHRALRRKQNPSPPPAVNGHKPELQDAAR